MSITQDHKHNIQTKIVAIDPLILQKVIDNFDIRMVACILQQKTRWSYERCCVDLHRGEATTILQTLSSQEQDIKFGKSALFAV